MALRRRRTLEEKKKFAERLNSNLPESEKWFWREWDRSGIRHKEDKKNEVICGFIPDISNALFKYVIEVNGSFHLKEKVKRRDARKTRRLEKHGWTVFHLEAYNADQFGDLVELICKHRESKNEPT